MEKEAIIDVIIPTYRPGKEFRELLERLCRQTRPVRKIIIMNTKTETDVAPLLAGLKEPELHEVEKKGFDHGGTRDMGARLSDADYLLFLTQDALPADDKLVEKLAEAFSEPRIKAAYARQLPREDCRELERYTRDFNYPAKSRVKSEADLETLGIKTFFCSNVCAMYERETYVNQGGFIKRTIFNEDMIYAGGLIRAGYAIAYAAEARVVHSHNYSGLMQFHRNFDLAVSQADHPEIFDGVPSEGEGIRLVKKSAAHCLAIRKPWLIAVLIWQSGWKYLGYKLGRNYRKLPGWLILRLTMNPAYWLQSEEK